MIVKPNLADLLKKVPSGKYSLVIGTAKRARQIIDGRDPLVTNTRGKKPLSIAVEELNSGVLKILTEDEVRNEREKQAAYDEKVREEKAKRREEEKQKNEAKKSDRGRSLDSLDEEEEYEGDETVPGDAEEADNAPSDEE